MAILSKNCGACGKPIVRSGLNVKAWLGLLLLGLLAACLLLPILFIRTQPGFVRNTRLHFQGDPATRLQAGRSLMGKSSAVLATLAPAYLLAIRTSDTDTRVALIRMLVDINRAAPPRSPKPYLPKMLITGLNNEIADGNPAVKEAVADTLRTLAEPVPQISNGKRR